MKVTNVNGHATNEMVAEGTVRRLDKEGNDISDTAADRGAETIDIIAFGGGIRVREATQSLQDVDDKNPRVHHRSKEGGTGEERKEEKRKKSRSER